MEFSGEARIFLTIILTGCALGCVFDIYRVGKNTFKLRKLTTSAADILYWLLASVVTFAVLLVVNGGQIRFYVLFALVLGAVIYFWLISGHVVSFLIKMVKITVKTKNAVEKACKIVFLTIIVRPVCFIYRIISRPFKIFGRTLKRLYDRLLPPPDQPPE